MNVWKYDVWDIMKSNSNGKLDVNVLVLGSQMKMMKIWNFMMLLNRNAWDGVAD